VDAAAREPILEMRGITKQFSGIPALAGVDFRAFPGEVMALLGENGAGKSTLMKILSGVHARTSGEILFQGAPLELKGPRDAQLKGISIIHQELNLVNDLSIAENIYLGREPVTRLGNIDWKLLNANAAQLLSRLGIAVSPTTAVGTLSVGQQQMVEIAKALAFDASILIMDEPTAALADTESASLFRVIRELRASGKAVIYISHRLKEVFELSDRVTVLRDGKLIGEVAAAELTEDSVIEMMVGRRLTEQYPHIDIAPGPVRLSVDQMNSRFTRRASFALHGGEILGVTGLMGAGRTELALALYGALRRSGGTLLLDGEPYAPRSPHDAVARGVAYISEDRKRRGLLLGLTVQDNITLGALQRFQRPLYYLSGRDERAAARGYVEKLAIRPPRADQLVRRLSGGNQQKVSIAKGLMPGPKVLILDEPTRGVDIGAKHEIYTLINGLKRDGLAILMISSDMPEILGMSDRIMVMHEGEITGLLARGEATQETIMRLSIGLEERHRE
jgi:ribose transport system ATP-binding protein